MAMGKIYRARVVPRKPRKKGATLSTPVKRSIAVAVRRSIKYSGESKYYYTSLGTTNYDWNGTLQNLSLVPQGTTDVGRIGDAITPMNLEIKGQCVLNSAVRTFCMSRMIIFRWLQNTDDTAPNVADIVDFVGTDQVTNSAINHDKRTDINVLLDTGPVALHSYGLSGYHPKMYNINKRIKLAGQEIKYVGAGTNAKNHLYVLFLTDVSAANLPYYRFEFKLNYKD